MPMPAPAAIVRLIELQIDQDHPGNTLLVIAYRLYFCGVDVEEQNSVSAPAAATPIQIRQLVNDVIVAAAADRGCVVGVDRIYTSGSICGI